MAQPQRQSGDPPVTAITSRGSKWTHLYVAGRSTACGRTVDINRWTVRASRLVPDAEWCALCWSRTHG